MTVYIIFIAFVGVSGLFLNSKPHFRLGYLIVTVGYLFIITGWRSFSVGSDTYNYVSSLESLGGSTESIKFFDIVGMLHSRFEYGYVLLTRVVYHFTNDPQWLLIACAIIVYIGLFIFLKILSADIPLSLTMFVTLGYMAASMNVVRQSLATSFIMIAFIFLMKNRNFMFIAMVFCAFLFHKTAIIFLLVILLKGWKYNKRNILIVLMFSGIIAVIYGKMESTINAINYTDYADFNATSGYLGILINILLIIFLLCIGHVSYKYRDGALWNKYLPDNSENLLPMLLIVSIGIYMVSLNFSQLVRIATYFELSAIIYIPSVLRSIKLRNVKLFLTILTYSVLIIYFFIVLIYRPYWTNITPYMFN